MEGHGETRGAAGEVAHHHINTVRKTSIVWSGAVHRIQDHVTLEAVYAVFLAALYISKEV